MRPWSYSRLSSYEGCPRRYHYNYVLKTPSSRPPSPAASRGTLIHEKAEKYLRGEVPMYPPELQKVSSHAMRLKAKGALPEQKLAIDDKWAPCDYDAPEVMLRAIIDVIYPEDDAVHVQDWKTGQAYPTHASQIEQYAVVAAAHYPDAKRFHTCLIYIDQGIITPPRIVHRERVIPIRQLIDARIANAEADTEYKAKPSAKGCLWCDYSKRYGGPCTY
jgi:PD-(D/E)XK nuclease superfamily